MLLHPLAIDLLSFGFECPSSIEPGTGQVWVNPNRYRTGLLLLGTLARPAGKGAGLIAVRPRLFLNDGELQSALSSFCTSDRLVTDVIGSRRYPDDLTRVRLSWGHATSYGADGVVLIGDAAHAVTPAGGQGANMAIADARVLADVGLYGELRLVDEYERRRRPANERSMRISRAASRVISLPDFVLAPMIPTAFRLINSFPQVFARGLRFVATAFQEQTR